MKTKNGFSICGMFAAGLCLSLLQVNAADSKYVRSMKEGMAAYEAKKWSLAEQSFKAALAEKEKIGGVDKDLQATLAYLGVAAKEQGKLNEAETYGKKGIAVTEKVFGINDAETAKQYRLLASIEMSLNHTDDAEKLYLKAMRIFAKVPEYNFSRERTIYGLEQCYIIEKKFDQAIELAKQDQALATQNSSQKGPMGLTQGLALANIYALSGNAAKAHEVYNSLFTLAQSKAAPANLEVALRMAAATQSFVNGDYDYAENILAAVLSRHSILSNSKDSKTVSGTSKAVKGESAVMSSKFKEQDKTLTQDNQAQHPITDKSLRAGGYLILAQVSAAKGDSEKFKTYLAKAKEVGETLTDRNFPQPLLRQAVLCADLGNRELASRDFKIALMIDEKLFGKNSSRLLIVLEPYMDFLRDIGDSQNLKALTLLREQIANVPAKNKSH